MKILLSFLLLLNCMAAHAEESPLFKTLFAHAKIKGFLELGLGIHTPFLLDSCQKVISIEFVTPGYGAAEMKKCLAQYKTFSNWIPITFFSGMQTDVQWAPYKYLGSELYYRATSYQSSTRMDYSLIDSLYLMELDSFIGHLTKCHKLQAALVNGAIYLRGDLVQLLFNKLPIIIAEGTSTRMSGIPDPYGYFRVTTPENYEEIYLPDYQTTVWALKNSASEPLIHALKTL